MGWRAPRFLPVVAPLVFGLALWGCLGPARRSADRRRLAGRPGSGCSFRGSLGWTRLGPRAWAAHLLGALYLGLLLACLGWPGGEAGSRRGAGRGGGGQGAFRPRRGVCLRHRRLHRRNLFGRHRLWPAVSPKKTWEGLAGGLMASVITAGLLAGPFVPGLGFLRGALLGLAAGVAAQIGDLVESRLKREGGCQRRGRDHSGARRGSRPTGQSDLRGSGLRARPKAAPAADPGSVRLRAMQDATISPPGRPRRVTVLGSTGSIGRAACDVIARLPGAAGGLRPGRRARTWTSSPSRCAPFVRGSWRLGRADLETELRARIGVGWSGSLFFGPSGVESLAAMEEADVVLNGLVGAAGLRPTWRALTRGPCGRPRQQGVSGHRGGVPRRRSGASRGPPASGRQ